MLLSTYFERRLNKNVDKNLCAKISFSLLLVRKLSLVNETPEARDRDVPTLHRDRDETETLGKCVSRPRRRDRDYVPEVSK